MVLVQEQMYVVRRKGTNQYTRNNGYRESLDSNCKSAIKLYETEKLAKSSVRCYGDEDDFDFVPVNVTISEI